MISIKYFGILIICTLATTSLLSQNRRQPVVEKVDTIYIASVPLDNTPVLPFGDTLFYVYGNIGSFSSSQRAKSIESKIKMLGGNYLFEGDSLKLVEFAGYLNIMYKKEILMSVDSLQALQEGKTRVEAAQLYVGKIENAIEKQLYSTSWKQILIQILGVIAILIAEYFILKLVSWIYKRLKVLIRLQRGKNIKGFLGIIDDQRATIIATSVLKAIRLIFVIIFLYLGVLVLFKLFPYTKHLSDELLNYVITPLKSFARGIINYLPNLFTIIVIIFIFRYIRKFIRSVAEKVAEKKITLKGFYPDWAFPTYNIISGLLFIFMFIMIFPYLPQSDSQIFQGVSVFAGIMLSLGSTSIIGNLVAGLVITYMRPFKIGDRIKIGEFTGDVLEKTALVTRIKTPKNEIITIPNSNVMSAQTINYSRSAKEHGLILYTTIGVGYNVHWKKVHEMLLEIASRTESISKKQKPFILQDQLNDFHVEYQLNVYIKDAKLSSKVYSDLRQHAQDVFAENNIEMISPRYEVSRRTTIDDSTIPKNYDDEALS